jgi:hypothetical protein
MTFHLKGRETGFRIDSPQKPSRLDVDPDFDVMRILSPSEIPPSINSLKGSASVLLVLPRASGSRVKELARFLADSLGLEKFRILSEDGLDLKELKGNDVLFLGLLENGPLPLELPRGLALQKQRFTLNGKDYDRPSDAFFGVFRSSAHKGRVTALFLTPSGTHEVEVARKITHYGKYSYLVFREGRNEAKGTWSVEDSPLVWRWEQR